MSDPTPFVRPTPPPLRQCTRCRLHFPMSVAAPPAGAHDPWSCAGCSDFEASDRRVTEAAGTPGAASSAR